MRIILIVLVSPCFMCCRQHKSEELAQDSLSAVAAIVIDTALDLTLASQPVFPPHSDEVFTNNENESAITNSVDSLLKKYAKEKFFAIKADSKTWYVDEHKDLRVIVAQRSNEVVQENSIQLFENGKCVAGYRDTDMNGQDTQRNRERIFAQRCPDCGVQFDLSSYDTAVTVLNNNHVKEWSDYNYNEYKSMLSFIAQAPIRSTESNAYIFERGEPSRDRYIVDKSLYDKFIKYINH